ncbi:hypothetical protein HPC49_36560 [Pyxidicoccus fallax]|uniref:Uncharacterized protein n=1 Tax=Pyxidicoccus fallax TaxID=394095 RepID=A0A848LX70_9BACT|nr:hypothetical protein [Pyxidicoccus fallax]NMO22142.1 hypothetical protein [Pyxidicoccus fallax]NPC83719.1 hypothetical protein [Pyxidicoccus fallax]
MAPEQLRPDTGTQSEEELLGWLVSGDAAQRAEAQARLLPLGESLLPRLELLAVVSRDDEARAGLLEFLQVLTARRVHPDQLQLFPELSAVAAKSVQRGLGLVAYWEVEQAPPGLVEELPVSPCGVGPQPESKLLIEGRKLLELRDKLGTLGGLARPGLEQLLSSPSPVSRLQGMVLAAALGLRPAPATLARLRVDPGEVELDARYASSAFMPSDGRVFRVKVSLSKRASLLTSRLDAPWREVRNDEPFALRVEDGLMEWFGTVQSPAANDDVYPFRAGPSGELLNNLRATGAWEATDAQQYWNRARPLWRLWWKHVGPRPDAYDRFHWLALVHSPLGYQIRFEPLLLGEKTVLHVAAPTGVEAELLTFPHGVHQPVVVHRGALPLTYSSEKPMSGVGVRLRLGETWVDTGAFFAPRKGERMTVWLQPELLRHFLEESRARNGK